MLERREKNPRLQRRGRARRPKIPSSTSPETVLLPSSNLKNTPEQIKTAATTTANTPEPPTIFPRSFHEFLAEDSASALHRSRIHSGGVDRAAIEARDSDSAHRRQIQRRRRRKAQGK